MEKTHTDLHDMKTALFFSKKTWLSSRTLDEKVHGKIRGNDLFDE